MSSPAIILVPADRRSKASHTWHSVGEKYLQALIDCSEAVPWIWPSWPEPLPLQSVLAQVDGVLLTGSVSNVGAHRYGQKTADPNLPTDEARDRTSFELIHQSLALGVPLFGICRGLQELNVALGGTLHQRVHEVAGMMDHRDDPAADVAVQYGPAHEVVFEPTSIFRRWSGGHGTYQVNSLHGQGIDRLADRLQIEARAIDGLIEAVSVRDAASFALGVQWHPEWRAADDTLSRCLFQRFGDAARLRQSQRKK